MLKCLNLILICAIFLGFYYYPLSTHSEKQITEVDQSFDTGVTLTPYPGSENDEFYELVDLLKEK